MSLATAAEPLEDGAPTFLENCSSIVERTTHGSMGHVAIIINEGSEPLLVEAIHGKLGHLKEDEYYAMLSRINACMAEVILLPLPRYVRRDTYPKGTSNGG